VFVSKLANIQNFLETIYLRNLPKLELYNYNGSYKVMGKRGALKPCHCCICLGSLVSPSKYYRHRKEHVTVLSGNGDNPFNRQGSAPVAPPPMTKAQENAILDMLVSKHSLALRQNRGGRRYKKARALLEKPFKVAQSIKVLDVITLMGYLACKHTLSKYSIWCLCLLNSS
jgi:hypothetical protein